jgi:acetyl esterase/lipase
LLIKTSFQFNLIIIKMKKKIRYSFLIFLLFSQASQALQQVIPIWTGMAPGSEGWTQKEIQYLNDKKQQMVRNVVNPTLTLYLPDNDKATGTAVIVAPGGGFRFLSWQTEGTEVAERLAENGVAAFVLKYRVMNTGATQDEYQKAMIKLYIEIVAAANPQNEGKPEGNILSNEEIKEVYELAQEDGRQAIHLVRRRASEWGIRPDRIGIMGFSAGGMVTLGTAMKYDIDSRPDFAGAIYAPWTGGTVPADAPPMFVLAAGDDKLASPGSIKTYNKWKAAGKDSEMHIYSKGGHGFGMQKMGLPADNWIDRYFDWMKGQGLM